MTPETPPPLTRLVHFVTEVGLGERSAFADGALTVAPDDVSRWFAAPALAGVRVAWASPGNPVRIVKVLDAVEPRSKGADGGGVFAGFLGAPRLGGIGETHVLRGVAVVAAGYLPRAQEALVDMSGPAASLSPLGSTHNLVVEFTPAEGADWIDVDRALRAGLLATAAGLAETAVDAEPDEVEALPSPDPATFRTAGDGPAPLPRVGTITNLQTQGNFKDVFVYARSFATGLPTTLEPGEVDDGAVVSGQFGHPALKNPTFVHQNHPVVAALRRRHGEDVAFAGLVISPEPVEAAQKELVCGHAARLVAALGWDGAIVTKEGGGNADGDMALKMDAMDDLGVASVGIYAEMSGADGTGPPVVVPPTRATAMVSAGNYDERLILPAMEVALGGDKFTLLDLPATSAMEVPVAVVYAALSPLGWGRLTCREGVGEAAGATEAAHGAASDGRAIRVVHYVNQFFAGLGGEDSAGTPPSSREGAVGPGRKLASLLGPEYDVVATVFCGDDHAVSGEAVTAEILDLVRAQEPDLLVAGPAFTSGRYGLACARLVAAAQAAGLAAVAALHPENPGLDEAGGAPVVAAGEAARTMGPSLERLAAAVRKVAVGEPLTAEDGRVGKVPRRNVVVEKNAAERAVDLVLARLAGDREATEVPIPRFDKVTPAAPVEDVTTAVVALVTEGAVVPDDNPDGLESARATRWLRYPIEGRDSLPPGEWRSVHGGFSTQWANADPHRVLPLDVARELEREGRIGQLHPAYLVTAGNGTSVGNARRFGVEWAADLRHSGARAAILTST